MFSAPHSPGWIFTRCLTWFIFAFAFVAAVDLSRLPFCSFHHLTRFLAPGSRSRSRAAGSSRIHSFALCVRISGSLSFSSLFLAHGSRVFTRGSDLVAHSATSRFTRLLHSCVHSHSSSFTLVRSLPLAHSGSLRTLPLRTHTRLFCTIRAPSTRTFTPRTRFSRFTRARYRTAHSFTHAASSARTPHAHARTSFGSRGLRSHQTRVRMGSHSVLHSFLDGSWIGSHVFRGFAHSFALAHRMDGLSHSFTGSSHGSADRGSSLDLASPHLLTLLRFLDPRSALRIGSVVHISQSGSFRSLSFTGSLDGPGLHLASGCTHHTRSFCSRTAFPHAPHTHTASLSHHSLCTLFWIARAFAHGLVCALLDGSFSSRGSLAIALVLQSGCVLRALIIFASFTRFVFGFLVFWIVFSFSSLLTLFSRICRSLDHLFTPRVHWITWISSRYLRSRTRSRWISVWITFLPVHHFLVLGRGHTSRLHTHLTARFCGRFHRSFTVVPVHFTHVHSPRISSFHTGHAFGLTVYTSLTVFLVVPRLHRSFGSVFHSFRRYADLIVLLRASRHRWFLSRIFLLRASPLYGSLFLDRSRTDHRTSFSLHTCVPRGLPPGSHASLRTRTPWILLALVLRFRFTRITRTHVLRICARGFTFYGSFCTSAWLLGCTSFTFTCSFIVPARARSPAFRFHVFGHALSLDPLDSRFPLTLRFHARLRPRGSLLHFRSFCVHTFAPLFLLSAPTLFTFLFRISFIVRLVLALSFALVCRTLFWFSFCLFCTRDRFLSLDLRFGSAGSLCHSHVLRRLARSPLAVAFTRAHAHARSLPLARLSVARLRAFAPPGWIALFHSRSFVASFSCTHSSRHSRVPPHCGLPLPLVSFSHSFWISRSGSSFTLCTSFWIFRRSLVRSHSFSSAFTSLRARTPGSRFAHTRIFWIHLITLWIVHVLWICVTHWISFAFLRRTHCLFASDLSLSAVSFGSGSLSRVAFSDHSFARVFFLCLVCLFSADHTLCTDHAPLSRLPLLRSVCHLSFTPFAHLSPGSVTHCLTHLWIWFVTSLARAFSLVCLSVLVRTLMVCVLRSHAHCAVRIAPHLGSFGLLFGSRFTSPLWIIVWIVFSFFFLAFASRSGWIVRSFIRTLAPHSFSFTWIHSLPRLHSRVRSRTSRSLPRTLSLRRLDHAADPLRIWFSGSIWIARRRFVSLALWIWFLALRTDRSSRSRSALALPGSAFVLFRTQFWFFGFPVSARFARLRITFWISLSWFTRASRHLRSAPLVAVLSFARTHFSFLFHHLSRLRFISFVSLSRHSRIVIFFGSLDHSSHGCVLDPSSLSRSGFAHSLGSSHSHLSHWISRLVSFHGLSRFSQFAFVLHVCSHLSLSLVCLDHVAFFSFSHLTALTLHRTRMDLRTPHLLDHARTGSDHLSGSFSGCVCVFCTSDRVRLHVLLRILVHWFCLSGSFITRAYFSVYGSSRIAHHRSAFCACRGSFSWIAVDLVLWISFALAAHGFARIGSLSHLTLARTLHAFARSRTLFAHAYAFTPGWITVTSFCTARLLVCFSVLHVHRAPLWMRTRTLRTRTPHACTLTRLRTFYLDRITRLSRTLCLDLTRIVFTHGSVHSRRSLDRLHLAFVHVCGSLDRALTGSFAPLVYLFLVRIAHYCLARYLCIFCRARISWIGWITAFTFCTLWIVHTDLTVALPHL